MQQSLKAQLAQLDQDLWMPENNEKYPVGSNGILQLIGDRRNNQPEEIKLFIFIPLEGDDLELIDGEKFDYFKAMESILLRAYSETTNSDGCSTCFDFNTNHAVGPIILTVTITDALS